MGDDKIYSGIDDIFERVECRHHRGAYAFDFHIGGAGDDAINAPLKPWAADVKLHVDPTLVAR